MSQCSFGECMKEIDGYDGYFIDEAGNVFSGKNRTSPRTDWPLKQLIPRIDKLGYKRVQLRYPIKDLAVHRLVAKAFIPNPLNLPFVLHNDDNPSNCCVDNLRWGTHQDNMDDKVKRNRQSKGEKHAEIMRRASRESKGVDSPYFG